MHGISIDLTVARDVARYLKTLVEVKKDCVQLYALELHALIPQNLSTNDEGEWSSFVDRIWELQKVYDILGASWSWTCNKLIYDRCVVESYVNEYEGILPVVAVCGKDRAWQLFRIQQGKVSKITQDRDIVDVYFGNASRFVDAELPMLSSLVTRNPPRCGDVLVYREPSALDSSDEVSFGNMTFHLDETKATPLEDEDLSNLVFDLLAEWIVSRRLPVRMEDCSIVSSMHNDCLDVKMIKALNGFIRREVCGSGCALARIHCSSSEYAGDMARVVGYMQRNFPRASKELEGVGYKLCMWDEEEGDVCCDTCQCLGVTFLI